MTTKAEAISHCLTYPEVFEDYPFHDPNWCVMRHRGNRRVFAWIFDKDGHTWINVKCDPAWTQFWRDAFAAVIPAYHLNKTHWNSIILDGTIPEKDICTMIRESYQLTSSRRKKT